MEPQRFRRMVLAPYLSPTDEQALLRCVAVDGLNLFVADSVKQGHERDPQATIVGRVFTQS